MISVLSFEISSSFPILSIAFFIPIPNSLLTDNISTISNDVRVWHSKILLRRRDQQTILCILCISCIFRIVCISRLFSLFILFILFLLLIIFIIVSIFIIFRIIIILRLFVIFIYVAILYKYLLYLPKWKLVLLVSNENIINKVLSLPNLSTKRTPLIACLD